MADKGHPAGDDGTVGKALAVLDLVAGRGQPVRFAQLAAEAGLPRSTLYRLLRTLTHQGMLDFDPDRQAYAPGLRLVRLAHAAWRQSALAPIARPHLDALAAETGETVHLAQLDAGQVVYVDKRNAREPVEMFSQAGKVGPAYCTGVGKAMLAYLGADELARALPRQSFHPHTPRTLTTPEALLAELAAIRAQGHAWDREEHEPGILCLAHPILARSGRVLGAVSLTTTTQRSSPEALAAMEGRLRAAARAIAEDAEAWRFPEADRRGP